MGKKIILLFITILATSGSFAQSWATGFDEAKKEASAKNCNILLVFSGSDWCAPCIKLDQNIWQSEVFKNYAKEHYALYKADFPKSKKNQLPEALQKENGALAEKYNKNGLFPLVVMLDKDGKVLGSTGFKNLTPKAYIELLASFEKKAKRNEYVAL